MKIEKLDFEVKTYNRLKKAGISTTDDLIEALYSREPKISAPDAKKCEAALKDAGIIKYMRGDYVTEEDIEPDPLTWDELHDYIGKLVVYDCSTESHRWLGVIWLYDIQDDGEGTAICSDGGKSYSYIRRSTVNGGFKRDPEYLKRHEHLKNAGRMFALRSREVKTVSETQVMSADYTKAVTLTKRIKANAAAAQESLWEVCKGLKEMHDGKLYKELGYQNFEEYSENEVGFGRRQAQKYLAIASIENGNSSSHFEKIGVTKLALLAKLDEPQREEIQQTTDLENTSVKELKAKIDDLKKANDRLMGKVDEAEKKAENSRKSEESACGKLSILRTDLEMQQQKIKQLEEKEAGYKERQDKLLKKNIELVEERDKAKQNAEKLEKQLVELENKPRDSFEDTTKINELTHKIEEMQVEHAAKIARLQSEFKNKESGEPEVCRAVFQAYLTSAADALHRLCDFTEEHKPFEDFSYYIARINKLISHAESEATRIGG